MNTNEMNLHRLLAQKDAEIERLHTENKTLFNLKLLQEEQFRYDIEQLREKYSERIYRMTTELVQRTDKIEHLTKALETLRYDYPTHLSGKAFDIVESALNSGPETME
jgi:predicted RNase H-like nuclease (RuvC/YqgF family)